ncbi:MAG: SGNH/GDSL hydrolase family protein [Lachnospiraceae bacterium]|nr:SGNH/GDSL hydrolase family protein [Lachnospiraceae bacterium]
MLYEDKKKLVDFDEGIAYTGNLERLKRVFKKAEKEKEKIKIVCLGGSITQGSLASRQELCYASRVGEWWKSVFKTSETELINSGIGGTTSQFGSARANDDVLAYKPDLVIIEFSVNDSDSIFFRETYEGLVRKIYDSETKPAVILLHNVMYGDGTNAQDQHEVIGRYYNVPCLSMKTSVYQAVASGTLKREEITPDGLHPNDLGHALLAGLVCSFFENVLKGKILSKPGSREFDVLPGPITPNGYEKAIRMQNYNSEPLLEGFEIDPSEQKHITDIFKRGFIGRKKGDIIVFEAKGSELAAQYRRSVKHPACICSAVVDGDEENAVILDGNFDETWGDSLSITTLGHGLENKIHKVKITVTDGGEDKVPFYLVSLICSGK